MTRARSKQKGSEHLFTETIARERLYYQSRLVVEGRSAEDWTEAFEIVNTYRGLEPPSATRDAWLQVLASAELRR